MKKSVFYSALLLFLVVIIWLLSCSKSSDSGSGGGGGTPPPNTVSMKGSAFSIPSLTVASGTKVTWVNDDNMIHTVTADNGSFDSGDIAPGMSFSFTVNTVGTFNYHCIHHAGMVAVLIVTAQRGGGQ